MSEAQDAKDDFERALDRLNSAVPREMPPSHPDQLLAEAGRGGQMPAAKLAGQFEAKYKKFCLDNDEDVEELEKINNHILNDGWLPAREEWLHAKSGVSFVVLKYLIPTEKAKKTPAAKPEKAPKAKPKKAPKAKPKKKAKESGRRSR